MLTFYHQGVTNIEKSHAVVLRWYFVDHDAVRRLYQTLYSLHKLTKSTSIAIGHLLNWRTVLAPLGRCVVWCCLPLHFAKEWVALNYVPVCLCLILEISKAVSLVWFLVLQILHLKGGYGTQSLSPHEQVAICYRKPLLVLGYFSVTWVWLIKGAT